MATYLYPSKEAHQQGKPQEIVRIKKEKIKLIEAECSWCHLTTKHLRITKHITPNRSKYQCQSCFRTTVKCLQSECKTMARAQRGWKENYCYSHNTKYYQEAPREAHCSWCFETTIHSLYMDNAVNKISNKLYSCKNCHKCTVKCSKCKKNMARLGGLNSTSKCFQCCGLIEANQTPEESLQQTSKISWCPFCITFSTHQLKEHFYVRKDIYECGKCGMETSKCNSCDISMTKSSSLPSRCSLCKHNHRDESYWINLQAKYNDRIRIYEEEGFVRSELNRRSKERTKAREAGLIKPFLLLVSMHPDMRSKVAFQLEIQLLKKKYFGDSHTESFAILFHKKKGIQRRSNNIPENLGMSDDANWYQILRRSIRDVSGYSTFISRQFNEVQRECLNPRSELLDDMEIELLDMIAQRYLQMFPIEIREKAEEIFSSKEIKSLFEYAKNEGIKSDSVYLLFISLILSKNIENINENMQKINLINHSNFLEYLKRYLHGKNSTTNRLKKVENFTIVGGLLITKILIFKTITELISVLICPPLGIGIEIGFLAIVIPAVIVILMCRSKRDVSCPAIILIVLQKFLLAVTHEIYI